ncbi:MAG: transposase [Solirubrobacteraceae bacterium]
MHALWSGAILAHIDFLDEQIDRLSDAIEEQIAPFAKAVELLCTIPRVQRRGAEVIISEIRVDMSVFPTDKHLASWPGSAPATISPPASAVPGRAARAPNGSTGRSRNPPSPRSGPRTSTSPPNTPG